eukprot:CAMPEP_0183445994 /NCGR_PEP_ID=MMETSP0370-20130417/96657_1 /TAXON_ID=268820 /ORGANISM="Peridinium aciculiferum, Strain PAER-2" /LENGTH=301 /DNA_ID=CAMNT_0025636665 /DNA_START=79 /DNA_END=984 /DNA_ORIENTATION=-
MTGNVLYLGRTVAVSGWQVTEKTGLLPEPVFYLSIIVAYVFGLIVHQAMERCLPQWTATAFAPVLALGIMALELFEASGSTTSFLPPRWNVMFLAPIFAVQANIAVTGGLGTTTMMATGHIHSLSNYAVQACTGELSVENMKKVPVSLAIVVSLALGALMGAFAVHNAKDPPTCSLGSGCEHLGLSGNCCPTDDGVFLGCCRSSKRALLLLLPVGPVLALTLVTHDLMFRKRKEELPDDTLLSPRSASGSESPQLLTAQELELASGSSSMCSQRSLSSVSSRLEENIDDSTDTSTARAMAD